MKILNTPLADLLIIEPIYSSDSRGVFRKLFNYDFFSANQLDTDFKEFYYSVSEKNVIRGMHFQIPPNDHVKLVYVTKGSIKDVVVDLREKSSTYGRYFKIELNENTNQFLYIPKGFAHGFLSLESNTIVNYAQTSCYARESDCGILYNSIGYDWGIENPIVSDRDLSFEKLVNFQTPFK